VSLDGANPRVFIGLNGWGHLERQDMWHAEWSNSSGEKAMDEAGGPEGTFRDGMP